jgi:hypothetical protein
MSEAADVEPIVDECFDHVAPALWNRSDWAVCVGILAASLILVALHVSSYTTLSPIDELQHIDYVIKAGEFDIPVRNERVGQAALSEAACRGVDAPLYVGPPCGLESYDPNDFQENGFNTAAGQFPPYYITTGIAARALTATGVVGSKVTAARMLGALWLAGALSVTWYLMACLDLRRRNRAPIIVLLLATPLIIFHSGATVNADVSLMLTGAVVGLATVTYEAGRLRSWWLPLIYVSVLFVEATNILAVAACGLYLIARRLPDTSLPMSQRFGPLALLPALMFFRLEVSGRIHAALFPPAAVEQASDRLSSAPMFTVNRADGVSFDKVIGQLSATFTPVHNPYVSPPLRSPWTLAGMELTNWLLIALMFATAVLLVGASRITWFARITVVMLLAAGPFYTLYFAVNSNQDFPAPARFALPLVPFLAVAAVGAIRQRATLTVVWVVAAFTSLNTVVHLLTA